MAKKQKTQIMSYNRYEKWFEQLSKQGYELNDKMNKEEFDYNRKQLEGTDASVGEINKSIKQSMFTRSYKQASVSRENLFTNLDRISKSPNPSKFEQFVLEKAKEYGLDRDNLSISDMRKLNGKIRQFDDDIQQYANKNEIKDWSDQIFGS